MVAELLKSVRYIVDAQGQPSAAVVDFDAWSRMIAWLEDQEDLVEAHQALRELRAAGDDAARAGWPRWEDLQGELDG
jgi:hypothetical protein